MSLEAIIIAAWPFDNQAPAHPDDKCRCGTTRNGAKPEVKAKRPHADLIEKRLNESHWSYRIKGCSHWTQVSAPSFDDDVEYKQEAAFTEGRKKLIRDWLDGIEYDYNPALLGGKTWRTATADEVINAPESYLRKKPTTEKVRSRVAVLKPIIPGYPPGTATANTDNAAGAIEKRKDFIRWMGPWQETEVEISKA